MEGSHVPRKHAEYDGYLLPNFPPIVADVNKHMQWIRDFESRDTDILLCSFPKSGSNWLNEIISMLLAGKSEYSTDIKMMWMLESATQERIDTMASPRLLNTHVPFRHIPQKHVQNGYKIVRILRNPKDCAVSAFNHVRKDKSTNIEGFPGTWEEYIAGYCQNKYNIYDGWWNYEKEWEKAIKEKKVTNVHTVFYEDLKKNNVAEIKRLADFLEVRYTDELIEEIADKCSFDKLSKAAENKKGMDLLKLSSADGTNLLFRKGQIGDWKNWFTVAQNEMFDATNDREMKDSTLKFIYEN